MNEIAKLPEADPRIAVESQTYWGLLAVMDGAINAFSEELRHQVQAEATETFHQLASEKEFVSLIINDHYGLEIQDQSGRFVPDRSAGAEQIIALSLIGALNRSAVREGPVIMDTPFGRLDLTHRANVLKYLPTMSHQVILLVQSGEIDIDRDLSHLEGKIGRQYRLVRDGSATRSRIDKLRTG